MDHTAQTERRQQRGASNGRACKGARGIGTPVLAPGASGIVTHDFTTSGTYEYLSAAHGPDSRDAFAGMKGELTVT
jgi:plastocyanin